MESKPANQRSSARLAAVQALYQMDVGGASVSQTISQFVAHHLGKEVAGDQYRPADADFFATLIKGVVARQVEIDPLIDAALTDDWPVTRINVTLRAILRAAGYEMLFRKDVPAKVVISEYMDVANAFFGAAEAGMVNGVLDRIARQHRRAEMTGK
jgi:transcription antitermination protein NusB